ncbi:hypothetical protein BDZ88DRAFT_414423 [Geranomyces variabilis]|nr:hypothetical protein BDZ88DRAFT_414423 [Geranomyces variabilis]
MCLLAKLYFDIPLSFCITSFVLSLVFPPKKYMTFFLILSESSSCSTPDAPLRSSSSCFCFAAASSRSRCAARSFLRKLTRLGTAFLMRFGVVAGMDVADDADVVVADGADDDGVAVEDLVRRVEDFLDVCFKSESTAFRSFCDMTEVIMCCVV